MANFNSKSFLSPLGIYGTGGRKLTNGPDSPLRQFVTPTFRPTPKPSQDSSKTQKAVSPITNMLKGNQPLQQILWQIPADAFTRGAKTQDDLELSKAIPTDREIEEVAAMLTDMTPKELEKLFSQYATPLPEDSASRDSFVKVSESHSPNPDDVISLPESPPKSKNASKGLAGISAAKLKKALLMLMKAQNDLDATNAAEEPTT